MQSTQVETYELKVTHKLMWGHCVAKLLEFETPLHEPTTKFQNSNLFKSLKYCFSFNFML